MEHKVFLVGAGPGEAGLLTCRGRAVLERAHTVIYDALVGPEVLALIPETARAINVGKRAGHHSMTQEEINRLLIQEARRDGPVARLKGGDPFLFGRGGEEALALKEAGIPYEVVPGVSSALAVPACCGIPVSQRGMASSVHIVAGHSREGTAPDIPYEALAHAGGTLVFLMGLGAVEELSRGLLKAGMDPETPAAVLQQGATAGQKTFLGTLKTIPQLASRARAPALFLVGSVCGLAPKLSWKENLPLFGCRIAVTRPRGRGDTLVSRLRELGAEVPELPATAISPLEWTLPEGPFTWVVFTSPRAVAFFREAMRKAHRDLRALAGVKIAAVGPGTAAALEDWGLFCDLIPRQTDSQGLLDALAPLLTPLDRVLLPRAKAGDKVLPEGLAATGARVEERFLYDTAARGPGAVPLEGLTAAILTSPSAARGFLTWGVPEDTLLLCMGQPTARAVRELGRQPLVAEAPTEEALVRLALRSCSRHLFG